MRPISAWGWSIPLLIAGFLLEGPWGCCPNKNNPSGPVTVVATATPSGAGATWHEALAATTNPLPTQFPGRTEFGAAVFNGALWVAGGKTFYGPLNDVWKTTDGVNWTKVLGDTATPPSTQFSERDEFRMLVYDNAMWVIGGAGGAGDLNDVWKSSDGVTWTRVLADASSPPSSQFSERKGFGAAVYNGAMWVAGGDGLDNDVWTSTDGATWNQVLSNAASPPTHQFSQRYGSAAAPYGSSLWLAGGLGAATSYLNDVWNSTDGVDWTQALADNASPPSTRFSGRVNHSLTAFDGDLWVIGGYNGSSYLNDVWHSSDGAHWTQAASSAAFSPRLGQSSVVYNGELWVIGGQQGTSGPSDYLNDVWYSP